MIHLWYTLGPASLGKEKEMLIKGATGVRLTFSYGDAKLQGERARLVKELAASLRLPCVIVADLAGEKFRLGEFEGIPTIHVEHETIIKLIYGEACDNVTNFNFPVPHKNFFKYIKEGTIVNVGDGGAAFKVINAGDNELTAKMMGKGIINQCRGLSIQNSEFKPRSLTQKDIDDLNEILSSDIYDVIALSFVSSAEDIYRVRKMSNDANREVSILAKVETASGLENIDSICQAADIVMAGRGDLALNLPWVQLPEAVEKIAYSAYKNNTPWYLATQIVEGLEKYKIPTRAEICDLANWMNKGCDGVLLSYETAFGSHPISAIDCVSLMLKAWKGH
jgi:pyruvate kinase